jgi:hypothetical protein
MTASLSGERLKMPLAFSRSTCNSSTSTGILPMLCAASQ